MIYTRAPQGLLGMSEFEDEVTNKVLRDLVASGHAMKIVDNIFYGAETLKEAADILL